MNISVSNRGAELQSIVANGREYLWQGDPAFWGRRAPILFPIVGKLADDKLRINGREYTMKQHGFARDAEFTEHDGWYVLAENGRDNFPYAYELAVKYEVDGNTLTCNWQVTNRGDETMYFQIGAHPAFLLPEYDVMHQLHGHLRCYDGNGNTVLPVTTTRLVDGLRQKTAPKVLANKDTLIPITDRTFADDAIILDAGNIAGVGLMDAKGNEILRVSCPQAQVFGLWAPNKPGCPFVCIEPWCGIADNAGFKGDISERDCIHSLESGKSFDFCYSITLNS